MNIKIQNKMCIYIYNQIMCIICVTLNLNYIQLYNWLYINAENKYYYYHYNNNNKNNNNNGKIF